MKQSDIGGKHVYQPEWADPADVQRWLRRELFVGETLNSPCGESTVGDVRADIDDSLDPDVTADLNHPLDTFEEQSFDTVYSDPPYEMFHSWDDEFWPQKLWVIARERLILQGPRRRVIIPKASKSWYVVEPTVWTPSWKVHLFQVFDRPDRPLTDFADG